jgi:hypothetical protein
LISISVLARDYPLYSLKSPLILARALAVGSDKLNAVDVWSNVFEIEATGDDRLFEVTRRMALLRNQLRHAQDDTDAHKPRPEKYQKLFESLFSAMRPGSLVHGWRGSAQHLTDDVMEALDRLAWELPTEEHLPSKESLKKLLENLDGMRRDVSDWDLSPDLRRFVLQQLDSIVTAIRDYDIEGSVALRRAVERALWDLARFTSADGPTAQDDARAIERLKGIVAGVAAFGVAAGAQLAGFPAAVELMVNTMGMVPLAAAALGLSKDKAEPKRLPAPQKD